MGHDENQVNLFLQSKDNEELLEKSKNSFKLLYTYPELFTFLPDKSGFINIETLRGTRDSSIKAMDIKELNVLENPLERQELLVAIDKNTYLRIYNGKNFQIRNTDLLNLNDAMRVIIGSIQTIIMVAVKLFPETFTKDKIQIIVENIDFSKSLKEIYIKNQLMVSIDKVLKIDYEGEIVRKNNDIIRFKENIQFTSDQIVRLMQDQETWSIKIIETTGAIRALEEAKDNVEINHNLLEELYNGLYTHPELENVKLEVVSQNILKVKLTTKPIKLSAWNFSPEKYLKNHHNEKAKLSEVLYTEVFNRTGLVEAYYSPYEVIFYIRFRDGKKTIEEVDFIPLKSNHRNPHEKVGCTGNFREHLRDAQRNGNILRFVNILMQYLSTTTVGDGAGNDFYFKAVITMKGDEIEWQRDSEDSLKEKRRRLQKLKENQNS